MPTLSSHVETFTVDGRLVRCRVLDAASASPQMILSLPLILLHGLGCSSDVWRPALDRLAERQLSCPVYVPDMPGFGCSPGPKAALGMEELGDWIVRLMDVLGLQRVHLAANSMGCQVALAIARRHPERVGGVVLMGPTAGEQYISFWRYALGLMLDGFWEPFAYTVVLTRMCFQMGLIHYLETTKKMLEDEPIVHAAEVDAPCLILRGGKDSIIPESAARRLAAALPKGEFRRLPRASHALQFGCPVEFVEIALTFWQRAEA